MVKKYVYLLRSSVMDSIEKAIISPLKDIISKIPLEMALALAVAGAGLVIVLFLLSLVAVALSANKAFGRKLEKTTEFLRNGQPITEETVEPFNARLDTLSEPIKKGWGYFLEQRDGYPSDYITQRDAFEDRKPARAGKVFFGILSAIAIALVVWLTVFIEKGTLASVGLADFTENFELVGSILAAFFAPFIIYVILRFVLAGICSMQLKKVKRLFSEFQSALDEKVLIYDEEEDEFISENISAINAEIEEILASKLNKQEVIEIVTVPKMESDIEEEPVVEAPVVEEAKPEPAPAPEIPAVEVAAAVVEEEHEETQEEKESTLIEIVYLVERLSKDEEATREDLEQLTFVIASQLERPNRTPKDIELLESCLYYLADIAPLFGL